MANIIITQYTQDIIDKYQVNNRKRISIEIFPYGKNSCDSSYILDMMIESHFLDHNISRLTVLKKQDKIIIKHCYDPEIRESLCLSDPKFTEKYEDTIISLIKNESQKMEKITYIRILTCIAVLTALSGFALFAIAILCRVFNSLFF